MKKLSAISFKDHASRITHHSLSALLIAVFFALCLTAPAFGAEPFTAADIAGMYDIRINILGGSEPVVSEKTVDLKASGIWLEMCRTIIGPDEFEYPCKQGYLTIEDGLIYPEGFPFPVVCEELIPGVLYCFIPEQSIDAVAIRRTE